jgi:CheY-like chemotaxis protein
LSLDVADTIAIRNSVRTILVVDDEEGIQRLFQHILEAEGYTVLLASDGNQAVRLLKDRNDIDLVITDLVMPNCEGIETIRLIRGLYPGLKIVAISGAFAGQYLKLARILGADRTLAKPVEPEVLVLLVKELSEGGNKSYPVGR